MTTHFSSLTLGITMKTLSLNKHLFVNHFLMNQNKTLHFIWALLYKKQNLLATSSDDLLNFLNSDEDIRLANELMKKQLTPHMANSMEGLLTEEELENALFIK